MKPSLILAAVFLLISTVCGNEGVKTVRHAYTSSSSSGNSFASSFAGSGSHGIAANFPVDFPNNAAFWWAKSDSPFKQAYEYFQRCTLKGNCADLPGPFDFAGIHGVIPNNLPENGCGSNGCSFSGSFNLNDKSHASKGGAGIDLGPIDVSKNPFLNGEYNGVAFSSCSGNACPGGKPHSTVVTTSCKGSDCKTNTQHGTAGSIDLSGNPFLSGGFAGVGISGSGKVGVNGGAGAGAGCSGAGGCSGGVPQVQPPHLIGGCAGTQGGCGGSSSSSSSFGGSYSGFGVSGGCSGKGCGSGIPVITTGGLGATGSGCSGGSGTGCGGQDTFVSTGELGFSGTQPGSGCSGVKGGCGGQGGSHISTGSYGTTGQFGAGSTSTSFGGSTSIHGGSTSGEHGTTGGDSKGIFTGTTISGSSQFGIPTTHPGQSGQPGQPGQSGQPGQPGQSGHSGQFDISTSHPGQGQPGQPGQPGQSGHSGQFGISTSHPGQGQPGQPGQPGQSGHSGQFGISTSHPGQGQPGQPGQPGQSGHPGQSGQPGQHGQFGIPTSHPGQGQHGQTGFTSGSQTTSGSFGSTSFQQGISTTQPGKPGYTSGSQPIPTAQPGQSGFTSGSQTTTGSFGSTSGSFGSTSGAFSTTGSQQGGIKPIPTSYPSQTGFTSGTLQHGQSTTGSFSGSSTGIFGDSTTKQVGQSGQPDYTSGTKNGQTSSGSYGGSTSGSLSTSGSFGTGQTGFTSDTQHSYTGGTQQGQTTSGTISGGQTGYTSGAHGQTSFTSGTQHGGQTSFTSSPQSGQPTYTSGPQGGQPSYTSGPQTGYTSGTLGQTSFTSGTQHGGQTSFTSSPQGGQPTYTSGPQTGYTSGTHGQTSFTSGTQQGGQTSFTSSPQGGQPSYTSGPQGGETTYTSSPQGGQPTYTSGPQHGQSGYTSGTLQHGHTTGSFSTSGSYAGSGTKFTSSPHGKPSISGKLDIKCSGDGLICVKKHLCNNGIVNKNGEGLFQVRDGTQYCDVNTEICCLLPGHSGEPHPDIPLNIAGLPSGTYGYSTQNSHKTAASSSASSSSSSSTNTFFSSHGPSPTNPTDIGLKYTPGSVPDSSSAGTYQPGQSVPFGGKDGTSPGLTHILPDGSSNSKAPGLVHFGPGQASKSTFGPSSVGKPDLTHITPSLELSTPKNYYSSGPDLIQVFPNGEGSTVKPGLSHVTPSTNEVSYKNINNNFASSTIQAPGYLPPGPSPSPSPSSYSPDLLPPSKPSSPKPSTYYPAPKPTTSTGYIPPASGTNTSPIYTPTTKKPTVTNGYLPPPGQPNQVGSESTGNNEYLPPPREPSDSQIININVIPSQPKVSTTTKGPVDRIPDDSNSRETVIRPTTDFPLNTTPYPGCAAALKCVQGDFCTAEGVISTTRVILTKEQEEYRVPVTDCQDPETGVIGKCCRDPNYKDPWPASVLGQYRPDLLGFDDGTYKQKNKPQPGVKGGRLPVPRPNQPFEPNQIGSPSNTPNSFIKPGFPANNPNNPFDNRQVNPGNPVDFRPPFEGDYSQKYPTSVSKISSDTCGVRHPGTKPADSGPIDAGFAEIPWQAMVLRDSNRSLLCGGAIIRPHVVLTAAHCVEGLLADDVLVKGGEWKLGIDEEPKPFQINKVATIVRHPGYRPDTKLNDVALLILTEKFRLDKNVDTLCLPAPGEDIAKTFQKAKCITTGWGKTILQLNILNSVMHILGVGIVQGAQCQQQLQQYHSDSAYLYNANCVCGAPVQPQTDICDVDVGSALACDRGDGRYTLAGVYSWDTGCNPTAQIAGYTKVDTQWIETTLQRPVAELKVEEKGFYAQLQGQECHCAPGK